MDNPIIYIAATNNFCDKSSLLINKSCNNIYINNISTNLQKTNIDIPKNNKNIDKIFYINKDDTNLLSNIKSNILLEEDIEYLKKINNYKSYFSSLIGRFLIRKYFMEVFPNNYKDLEISFLKNGKPYLKNNNIFFNISHSKNLVVAIFYDNNCGIDIQLISEYNKNIIKKNFHKKEIFNFTNNNKNTCIDYKDTDYNAIKKHKDYLFTKIWTLKESYLKLKGDGLTTKTNNFFVNENNLLVLDDNVIYDIKFKSEVIDFYDEKYILSYCINN